MPDEPNLSSMESGPAATAGAASIATDRRPRMWTVFTVAVLGIIAAVLVQLLLVGAIVGSNIAGGMSPQEAAAQIAELVAQPDMFMLLAFSGQMGMALILLLAVVLSPEPIAARLAIKSAKLSAGGYAVLMLASLLPLAVSVGLAHLIALVIPPDLTIEAMYEQMTIGWAVPFVLFIALVPGIVEELLFRGYIQRRLLARWSPWGAITVTSIIFAIYHVTPHAFALAFVMGMWLGAIAWRTGSVLPGICCHAFVNGAWNVWVIGIHLGAFPEMHLTPLVVVVPAAAVVLAMFWYAVAMLSGTEPPLEPESAAQENTRQPGGEPVP